MQIHKHQAPEQCKAWSCSNFCAFLCECSAQQRKDQEAQCHCQSGEISPGVSTILGAHKATEQAAQTESIYCNPTESHEEMEWRPPLEYSNNEVPRKRSAPTKQVFSNSASPHAPVVFLSSNIYSLITKPPTICMPHQFSWKLPSFHSL